MPSFAAKMIKQYGDLQICWLRSFFIHCCYWGKFFPLFSFCHLLVIVYFFLLFGISLITLLCYVLYVNLVIVCCLAPFFGPEFFAPIRNKCSQK